MDLSLSFEMIDLDRKLLGIPQDYKNSANLFKLLEMRKMTDRANFKVAFIFLNAGLFLSCESRLTVNDESGVLGQTLAPVVKSIELKQRQVVAAREGRLGLVNYSSKSEDEKIIPVQWQLKENDVKSTGVLLMPNDETGESQFKWYEGKTRFEAVMEATRDPNSGQINITDQGKPVLRYNYQIVNEDDEFAFNGLSANEYITAPNDTFMANPSIYAVPRNDYIHPLFGLKGEILTRDWSKDHPHHRGIYWAWPEVDFGSNRGDLHALQKVFARPTGKIKLQNGPVFAQVEAENLWVWEDGNVPIVRELTLIRTYHQTEHGRIIDLVFQFVGLKDSVTIARRGTEHYGGLNIRMMTPEAQDLSFFTDEFDAIPRRGWSDLSGVFTGNDDPSGLMVFQHQNNPDYPGEWEQYPELSWVQPTFPTSGTRYHLEPGKPLVLRFRLIVHSGARPDDEFAKMLWDAFHSDLTPEPEFTIQ